MACIGLRIDIYLLAGNRIPKIIKGAVQNIALVDLMLLTATAPQAIIPDSFIARHRILFSGPHAKRIKSAVHQRTIANLGNIPGRTVKATFTDTHRRFHLLKHNMKDHA